MFKRLFANRFDTSALCSSQLYDNETFYKAFTNDLRCARQNVYIESPFITAKRMESLLPILGRLRIRGVSITVNTRNPDEHDGEYIDQAYDAVAEMQSIGITVLYTVKHHRKLAIIDGSVLWEGSLNILSQNDSCELMRRTNSEVAARQMMNFLRIGKYAAI